MGVGEGGFFQLVNKGDDLLFVNGEGYVSLVYLYYEILCWY